MTSAASAARCGAHPARLALDRCPVCGRSRCAPDAQRWAAAGCAVCTTTARARPPDRTEALVRAGLAGVAITVAGGWVATQYVNVHLMSLFAPALIGLAASWAAGAAAGAVDKAARWAVLAVAVLASLAGTALGFRLFGRPVTPTHPWHQVGPPYLAAVAGALAWRVLAGPTRRPRDVTGA